KVTRGTRRLPKGLQVTSGDEFGPPKTYDVKKASRLCTAADENARGVRDPGARLLCYRAKRAKGQPKHVRARGVFLDNELGAERPPAARRPPPPGAPALPRPPRRGFHDPEGGARRARARNRRRGRAPAVGGGGGPPRPRVPPRQARTRRPGALRPVSRARRSAPGNFSPAVSGILPIFDTEPRGQL